MSAEPVPVEAGGGLDFGMVDTSSPKGQGVHQNGPTPVASCPALADGGAPPAGDAVRALGWPGPREVEAGLEAVVPKLSSEDFGELGRRTGDPADLDGGAPERTGREWLTPHSRRFRRK